MTLYSAMVEVVDHLGTVKVATTDFAATRPDAWIGMSDLGEGWLGIRIQTEAVSLAAAAEAVTDLVRCRLGAEPLACYVMPEAEFERRVPRSSRLAVA